MQFLCFFFQRDESYEKDLYMPTYKLLIAFRTM